MSNVVIRPARQDERALLEALQWRASLANPGDRDSLLANPDAIIIPPSRSRMDTYWSQRATT